MEQKELTTVQRRIRFLFEESGLSQAAFAARIGIGQPHLSGVMSIRQPSKRLLITIAERVGANAEWLETGKGEIYVKGAVRPKDPPELARLLEAVRELYDSVEDEGERYEVVGKLLKFIRVKREELLKGESHHIENARPKKG